MEIGFWRDPGRKSEKRSRKFKKRNVGNVKGEVVSYRCPGRADSL